jgi:hypothetical protein
MSYWEGMTEIPLRFHHITGNVITHMVLGGGAPGATHSLLLLLLLLRRRRRRLHAMLHIHLAGGRAAVSVSQL